jgi:membrane protease YdiL (CAAX protease family)
MPQYSLDTVLLFSGAVVLQLLAVLHRAWASRSGRPVLPRRLSPKLARSLLAWQLGLVALLYLTYARGGWSAESVGLTSAVPTPLAFLVAAVAYGGLTLLYDASTKRLPFRVEIVRATFRANSSVWPRQRTAKLWAGAAILLLNPVTEELVMRGILVHQLGQLVESPAIPIALGLAANAALHSYQGARLVAWHLLFCSLALALLYSPLGLLGAIGAHAVGDAVPILTLRRLAREYRKSRPRTSARAAA